MDNTVNLRPRRPKPKTGQATKKAEELAKIYREEPQTQAKIKTIDRPEAKNQESWWRFLVFSLALIVLAFVFYWLFWHRAPAASQPATEPQTVQWYAITLANGKVFYGQIKDIAANPIVVYNVYYNYDNLEAEQNQKPGASLRLVKRGKETYGPSGEMDIYQAQILYLEPLRQDSKVLKAIRDYEEK